MIRLWFVHQGLLEWLSADPLRINCGEITCCNKRRDQNEVICLEIKSKITSLMSRKAQNGLLLFAKRVDTCEKPEIYHWQTPEPSLKDSNTWSEKVVQETQTVFDMFL